MGVDKTTYLMFGIRLNEEQSKVVSKNCFKEELNMIKYIEGRQEVDGWALIYDGMCGENHFFGKVLERMDSDDCTPYRVLNIALVRGEEFQAAFKERFGHCFGNQVELGDVKPQLMLINHFS
jgi:hypothetical protein